MMWINWKKTSVYYRFSFLKIEFQIPILFPLFLNLLILRYTVHHPICGHPICGQNPICGRILRARKIHKSGTWRISENKIQNLFLNKTILNWRHPDLSPKPDWFPLFWLNFTPDPVWQWKTWKFWYNCLKLLFWFRLTLSNIGLDSRPNFPIYCYSITVYDS